MSRALTSGLRFPGGKGRAQSIIQAEIDRAGEISHFVDCMVGGGSTPITLSQRRPELAHAITIGDNNEDLIAFYRTLADDREKTFVRFLAYLKETLTDGRKLYRHYKDHESISEFERAVRYYILNRITYSGLGDAGGYSDDAFEHRFTLHSIAQLGRVQPIIAKFRILDTDYADLCDVPGNDVLLFLDPPYFANAQAGLYGRGGKVHKFFDHGRLRDVVQRTKHKFIITYDDAAEIRILYKDFNIKPFNLQYGMDNTGGNEPKIGKEILITNF